MKSFDVVIVGGGFAGIYSSWRLAKEGRKVLLIEASDKIGGLMNSVQWKNYWMDYGTQELGMRTKLEVQFFTDILGNELRICETSEFASTTDKTWTYGFEMPDYGTDAADFCTAALAELQILKDKNVNSGSLRYIDDYRSTHGQNLTDVSIPTVQKYIGSDPEELSSDARVYLSIFDRPKLGDDAEMATLKLGDPFWDARLGVTNKYEGHKFVGSEDNNKSCYPKSGGLKSFCEKAKRRLLELGVSISLGQAVNQIETIDNAVAVGTKDETYLTKSLFWSLPEVLLDKVMRTNIELSKTFLPVGMCFYAFEVKANSIKGPNYLHDFNVKRSVFRYSSMGSYTSQVNPKGDTFVVAEVPSHPRNIENNTSDEGIKTVWKNFCDTGFVSSESEPLDSTCWAHPLYFALPKVGWQQEYKRYQHEIYNRIPSLLVAPAGLRGRGAFIKFYETQLKQKF